MSSKRSQIGQELGKFVQAAWLELPAAFAQRAVGRGGEEALSTAGWKAYDAWVALTNEATNRMYEHAAFGSVMGRAMESALRVQQVGSAVASAFFGNLWPAVGLPTSSELAAIRSELAVIRSELAELRDSLEAPSENAQVAQADDGLHLVRSNGHVKRIAEDKENAAA